MAKIANRLNVKPMLFSITFVVMVHFCRIVTFVTDITISRLQCTIYHGFANSAIGSSLVAVSLILQSISNNSFWPLAIFFLLLSVFGGVFSLQCPRPNIRPLLILPFDFFVLLIVSVYPLQYFVLVLLVVFFTINFTAKFTSPIAAVSLTFISIKGRYFFGRFARGAFFHFKSFQKLMAFSVLYKRSLRYQLIFRRY